MARSSKDIQLSELKDMISQLKYLKYLLEHRPSKDMTDNELAMLAPWNEEIQKKCSNKTEQNVSVPES